LICASLVSWVAFHTDVDAAAGDVHLASSSSLGEPRYGAGAAKMSFDGTKVAFVSRWGEHAFGSGRGHIFLKNLSSRAVELVSSSDDGVPGNNDSTQHSLSFDGRKVAFISRANNLDPADPLTGWDVYVKDLDTGDVELASTSDAGVRANRESFRPALSGDGEKVAFVTRAFNLDPDDTDDLADVFVKDLVTGDLTMVSTNAAGEKANNLSDDVPSLSFDGEKVAAGTWCRRA
jgi:Tol biopolymer transport system component